MTDVSNQIRDRIEAFVQELGELVRRAALESVSSALGGGLSGPPRARTGRPPAAAAGARSGKRTPEELEALTESVLSHIQGHPGLGVEQIAAELGITSRDLVLPIRKLVASGKLTTEGQKRATKYYANQRGSGAGSEEAAKPRGRGGSKRGAKKAGKRRRG